MTDIVERLRAEGAMTGHYHVPAIQREAAAEIEWLREESERLRAEVVLLEATGAECADEIERLRAALGEMVTTFYDAGCHVCGGDCASANPPVGGCPIGVIRRARALLTEAGR